MKVFGWISRYKPRVYLLTDGSGRHGVSRVPSTAELLAPLGTSTDRVFGIISDRDLYRAILEGKTSWFVDTLDRITESLIENGIDLMVADAMEGFNPAHDLCRALVDSAMVDVNRRTGRRIANYKFCLTEWDRSRQEHHDETCSHFVLDDDALDRKVDAAEKYAELRDEVRKAIEVRGKEYFRVECLKEVAEPFQQWDYSGKPDYEVWGEQRVAEGKYESVIRYEEQIVPILDAIRRHANGGRDCSLAARAVRI